MTKRKKSEKPSGPVFKACNQFGCIDGMVREVKDDRSFMRYCTCALTWKAQQREARFDGKAAGNE